MTAGTREVWERIAAIARFAPTPHNTQPFRIRPRDARTADLVLLPERLLCEEDHGNLYCLAAFGIFAEQLERAALSFGQRLVVTPISELDPGSLTQHSAPLVVGEARIEGETPPVSQEKLLLARRTSRLPYLEKAIEPAALAAMENAVAEGGHRLIHSGDPATVAWTLRLNTDAILDNLRLRDEREEIRSWTRLGPTPEHGDGLWQQPMAQASWELWSAFAVPWLFRLPVFRSFAVWRYLSTQRGTQHVGLIRGEFRTWPQLVNAGRMLLRFWLALAEHDVYLHPYGSLLTNAHYARLVAERFGVSDCWLIFRLGYSPVPARSPRLESILL